MRKQLLISGLRNRNRTVALMGLGTGGGSAPSNEIRDVLFSVKTTYRLNTPFTLNAIAAGVAVSNARWEVRRKSDNVLVQLAFGMTPTLTVSKMGFYNIVFKAQTPVNQFVRIFPTVSILPVKYTREEANLIITPTGNVFNDQAEVDRTGYKIYIDPGTFTGYFAIPNYWGTTGGTDGWGNHARVQAGGHIYQTGASGSDGFTITGNRYTIWDLVSNDDERLWHQIMPTGALFGLRAENTKATTSNKIFGFETTKTGDANDRAAVSIIPPVNATYNASTHVDVNSCFINFSLSGTGSFTYAEKLYIGYTNDSPQATYVPYKYRDFYCAHGTMYRAGNDGIQFSSWVGKSECHNITIDTVGVQGNSGHEAFVSYNEGNAARVYNIYGINGKMAISAKSGLRPWDIQAGETTPQPTHIYNCVFIEGTPPAIGGTEPVFNYVQTNNGTAAGLANTAEWPFLIYNCSFLCNKLGITYSFNATDSYRMPNLKLFTNFFGKTGGANEYSYTGVGTYPTSAIINNVVRAFSSYGDILFTSSTNLHPSSLSSPLFTGATNTATYITTYDLYDGDGFPSYDGSAYTHGAYARQDLKNIANTGDAVAATFNTPVAVGSLTQTGGTVTFETNKEGILYVVMVANGDSAPSAAQIIAGQNAAGTAAIGSVAILDGGTAGSGLIGGGSEGTAYDVYSVFKTKDFVIGAVQTKIDITTTADVTAPTIGPFEIRNSFPNRIYFPSSEIITASTFGGFTIGSVLGTVPTVTGIVINTGQLTDHYFTMSANFGAIDYNATIAYSGSGSNIQDIAGSPNALASFAATSITNSITATRINVNIRNNDANHSGNWNNAIIDGSGAVRSLIANLIDSNGSNTGYAMSIFEAFHDSTAIATTGGGLYLDSTVGARGVECYSTSPTSNAGTFRISGLAAGATGQIVYGTKGIFNTPTGTVSVTGGSAVAFANAYTEYRQAFVADGSGNLYITMTETTSNASICMVGFIVEVNP